MKKIEEIVKNAGMSSDPGVYSDRGATISDLNCDILEKIADAIGKSYNDEALSSFVAMVWKMETLSATAFLINLYALEKCGWDLSKMTLTKSNRQIENKDAAFNLVASSFYGSLKQDDTEKIRDGFRRV